MGNGKSKEGGKGGLLAVSRNSIDEPPPTKSNSSIRQNNRVNIYVDDSVNNNSTTPNNNNTSSPTTTNNNNQINNNNNSLHQSQLSNDSSSTNNNTATTPPNNQNNQNTTTTISNTNTDSTTSSSPNATNNLSSTPNHQLQLASFGAQSGSTIVFGVDVSVAVQRSCKLILKMLLQKKQQELGGAGNTTPLVSEESISEEQKNEFKHPLASDEEIEVIEKVCANLETLFIPEVIRQCLRFLNSYSSLLEQGVYRIPGATSKMAEYREAFDKGQSIDFKAENREIDRKRKEAQDNGVTVDIVHHGIKHDAHDVAGLIKLFLRELPGEYHLFTPQTAPEFSISYLKNFATEEEKVESVRNSLLRVPRANRDTLKALCEHFRLIIKYEKSNKMTTDNLLKCICGTSPYVLAFYFMVQYFDVIFREEKKEPAKPLTDEEMNSTKNIEWLLRAQNENNNVLSLGNLSHLTGGGNNNLTNEALAGKAMSARESRRKSYYQRQQRNDSTASEDTPTSASDTSGFASPPTIDHSNSDNLDPITLALLKMKKDKDTQNDSTITTNNVDTQEQNDSSITVEM